VNEEERYLFDLNGYLVVNDVLSAGELADVNAVLDGIGVPELLDRVDYVHAGFPDDPFNEGNTDPTAGPIDVPLGLMLDWGAPIRSLVAHEPLGPYLEAMLGAQYRLDHCYGIFMRKGAGSATGHHLHNGGTPFDPTQFYLAREGRMYSAMVVVSYALTDVEPGHGGFCCIPGSHKSSFPLPASIADLTTETFPLVQIPQKAGSVVIFTEAVTHGSLPWVAETNRRALLFKYCPGHIQWERDSPLADLGHPWTDRQRRALALPYVWNRPATEDQLQADGG
jgi:hypothetical protein